MRCTTEVFGDKLIGNTHRHIVVECVIIHTLHTFRHFRIALHLLSCPFLEVLTYLVNLRTTSLCSLLVGNGFSRAVPILFNGGNGDALVLDSRLNESVSHYGTSKHFTRYTHSTVFLIGCVIWLVHKPSTAYGSKLHTYIGTFFHILLVQFRLYPRTTQSKVYQVGRDCHWHNFLQCLDVAVKFAVLVVLLCLTEFLTHIATQILIRHFHLSCSRVFKAVTALDDFCLYFGFTLSELFCDVWNIYTTKLEDTCYNTVLDIGRHWLRLLFNNTLAEYIGLTELLHLVTLCIG